MTGIDSAHRYRIAANVVETTAVLTWFAASITVFVGVDGRIGLGLMMFALFVIYPLSWRLRRKFAEIVNAEWFRRSCEHAGSDDDDETTLR